MPGYNGSGTFARTYTWTTDKTNAVAVTASRMDTEHDGFATGLSTAICKDGQTTTTAAIPFAQGIKVSDGSTASPAVQFINDTDTGIMRIAENTIGIIVAGTVAMSIGTATISCAAAMSFTGTLGVSSGGTGVATTNSARINNNTSTVLTLDTEDHDTNTLHSVAVATSRLTAQVDGTYIITGNVRFAAGTSGTTRVVSIKKNGTTYLAQDGTYDSSAAAEVA